MTRGLPPDYVDLEPLSAEWSLPTESQRAQRHLMASYDELKILYSTLLPRMSALLDDLNQKTFDAYDDADRRLLWLALSFVEAAVAVERFQCADMPPGAFEAERFHIGEKAGI